MVHRGSQTFESQELKKRCPYKKARLVMVQDRCLVLPFFDLAPFTEQEQEQRGRQHRSQCQPVPCLHQQ